MHAFLSDEWIDAAREVRAGYADRLPPVEVEVRINLVVTDVPFGDGTIWAYIDTSEATLELSRGELDEPDATMMTDYATAYSIFVDRDPAAAMQAFMTGKIKVQGDMMKIMAMQMATPQTEAADELAAEIDAITLPPE